MFYGKNTRILSSQTDLSIVVVTDPCRMVVVTKSLSYCHSLKIFIFIVLSLPPQIVLTLISCLSELTRVIYMFYGKKTGILVPKIDSDPFPYRTFYRCCYGSVSYRCRNRSYRTNDLNFDFYDSYNDRWNSPFVLRNPQIVSSQ